LVEYSDNDPFFRIYRKYKNKKEAEESHRQRVCSQVTVAEKPPQPKVTFGEPLSPKAVQEFVEKLQDEPVGLLGRTIHPAPMPGDYAEAKSNEIAGQNWETEESHRANLKHRRIRANLIFQEALGQIDELGLAIAISLDTKTISFGEKQILDNVKHEKIPYSVEPVYQ
jgi:hypothetical protein